MFNGSQKDPLNASSQWWRTAQIGVFPVKEFGGLPFPFFTAKFAAIPGWKSLCWTRYSRKSPLKEKISGLTRQARSLKLGATRSPALTAKSLKNLKKIPISWTFGWIRGYL